MRLTSVGDEFVVGSDAARPGATLVACMAHDALIDGGDALAACQVQRTSTVILEDGEVVNVVGRHPDQLAHR
jgi:hypothetical protein